MKMLHLLKTLSVVLGLGCLTTLAGAAPVVDGRFEAGEGYPIGHFVNLSVEGAGPISDQGQLWYYQDKTTNDLYVAVTQPLTLVDNTYGASSIGWGKGIAPSGKSRA